MKKIPDQEVTDLNFDINFFLLLCVLEALEHTHGRIKVYFKKLPREKLEDNELEEPLEDDI